jgi:hypothetical protein
MPEEEVEPYLNQMAQQMQEQQEDQTITETEQDAQPAEPPPPQIHPLFWDAANIDKDF